MANEGFVYGGATFFSNPLFVGAILPFVLVFVLVFAILQKSKILGDGKKQIDAIVALVIGLLVISFGKAVGIIDQLMPFLAVGLVVILVLMLFLGAFAKEGDWDKAFPAPLRYGLMIVSIIAVIVAVIYVTGFWDIAQDVILSGRYASLIINGVFILILIGAVVAVVLGGGKGSSK